MKMVKSLLLGTAAGMVAVVGAQAADMPVKAKAKPVEYVKICTLYGAGFYYIPGTDTCIKIGGYIRLQTELKAGASGQVTGSGAMLGQGRYDISDTNDINYTSRAVATFDVRDQTEYGTLRSYFRAGWNVSTPAQTGAGTTPGAYWDRAFIQFAGFTVGRAQSFFDMFTYGGAYTYLNVRTAGDTGAAGANLWAYTVQFGNGVSYSLSLEDPAAHNKYGTVDNTQATFGGFFPPIGTFAGNTGGFFGYPIATVTDNGYTLNPGGTGFRVPDIVTNLRVDQAWGYVGISTAIHDASGGYYGTTATPAANVPPGIAGDSVNAGHPATKYGWAFSASGLLNLQGGDIVGVNFVWTKGAPGYAFNSGNWALYNNSNRIGVAWIADGVFGTGTDVELTEAWSINAGYQHIWGAAGTFGAKWRTSIYGGYVKVNYNDRATQLINSALPAGNICGGTRAGATAAPGVPTGTGVPTVTGSASGTTFTGWTPLAGNSCNPDFSFFQVGTRTQFNPHPLMDIGLDVFYTKLNTAYAGPVNWAGSGLTQGANGARPSCTNSATLSCIADDQNVLSAIVRWQRNFYP